MSAFCILLRSMSLMQPRADREDGPCL